MLAPWLRRRAQGTRQLQLCDPYICEDSFIAAAICGVRGPLRLSNLTCTTTLLITFEITCHASSALSSMHAGQVKKMRPVRKCAQRQVSGSSIRLDIEHLACQILVIICGGVRSEAANGSQRR